jgi:hypothetical protein
MGRRLKAFQRVEEAVEHIALRQEYVLERSRQRAAAEKMPFAIAKLLRVVFLTYIQVFALIHE